MKTLFQNDFCAFFASTIQDGDYAVPFPNAHESNTDFYRRAGWNYFFQLRKILLPCVPRVILPTKNEKGEYETLRREYGTVHIAQAVQGDFVRVVEPLLSDPDFGLSDRNVKGGPVFHAGIDGFCTLDPLTILVVTGGDCPPVLIVDPVKKAIALVHSGRHGTLLNIVRRAVLVLSGHSGTHPSKFRAIIGPGISAEKYEVNKDIADAFRDAYPAATLFSVRKNEQGKYLLDLKSIIAHQLREEGVKQPTIDMVQTSPCTYTDAQDWHSYRRDTHMGLDVKRPRVNAFFAMLLT